MIKRFCSLGAFTTVLVASAIQVPAAPAAVPAGSCDSIDPAACLLPYPNNHFTRADSSTPTKLRLNLPATGTPKNKHKTPIAVTDLNRADGFSPGSMLIAFVPGIDLSRSLINTITNPAGYAASNAGVVAIDTVTGKRQPLFGELDSHAISADKADLLIRPLRNWVEGRRYVVAIIAPKDSAGLPIAPSINFKALRDGTATGTLALRKAEFASIFATLKAAGVTKSKVYLAWQFTVASSKNLTGRLLSIRDRAFKSLGDTNLADRIVSGRSPSFTITRTINFTSGENEFLSRRVYGTINVPCFLSGTGCRPGSSFNLDVTGLPILRSGNVDKAPFVCNIPRSVAEGTTVKQLGFPVVYGHGLLGNYEAITRNDAYAIAGNDYGNVFCGLDWQGMASEDAATIGLAILPDLSNFNKLADRLQQGQLNFLMLARALIHPAGFGANAAFQFGGHTVLGPKVGFSGDSQGGILGGATVAVSPDFRYGSLGVPAINYSTLLDRSIDFDEYASIMYDSYPRAQERPLLMALIQQLWDRGEGDGYAQHISGSPLPNSPDHSVLLLPAFGDHQVSNLATEVYARTIGAKLRTPALSIGRGSPFNMFWGITNGGTGQISGNAMLMMDSGPLRTEGGITLGTPAMPTGNTPPNIGQDPHGLGGGTAEIRRLVSGYVRTGKLLPGCSGLPCGIGGWVPGL